jgi:polyisoprenoid-binding protein YceI
LFAPANTLVAAEVLPTGAGWLSLRGMTKLSAWCLGTAVALSIGATACKKENKAKEPEKTDPVKQPEKTVTPPPSAGDAKLGPIAGHYEIDATHAAVNFKIKHMGISDSLGRFNKVTGTIDLDGDLAKSKVAVEVDATSVFTADKKRDDHLKSPDFLNVAQFPTIKFTSTKIAATGDGYDVTGDLELHGVKKSITAKFVLAGAGKHMMDDKMFLVGFTGDLDLKRSDFGMTNMVGPVGDDVHLTIAVEAAKK